MPTDATTSREAPETAVYRMLQVLTLPRAARDGRRTALRSVPESGAPTSGTAPEREGSATPTDAHRGSTPGVGDQVATSVGDGGDATRPLERVLLDTWREAHWALRLRLRDLMGMGGASEVERLYDVARRADNQLNDFYRGRAEELTRRLRDLLVERNPAASVYDDARPSRLGSSSSVLATIAAEATPGARSVPPPTDVLRPGSANAGFELSLGERALLTRFRSMGPEDRAALLRVAQRLADTARRVDPCEVGPLPPT